MKGKRKRTIGTVGRWHGKRAAVAAVLAAVSIIAAIAAIFVAVRMFAAPPAAEASKPPSGQPAGAAQETKAAVPVNAAGMLGMDGGIAYGSYAGRFVCDEAKADVALYRTDASYGGRNAKAISDREDSAALIGYAGGVVISDHDYQGFAGMANVRPGAKARIQTEDGGVLNLVCTMSSEGERGTGITLDDGRELADLVEGKIAAYTCVGDVGRVAVTLWDALDADGAITESAATKEEGNE